MKIAPELDWKTVLGWLGPLALSPAAHPATPAPTPGDIATDSRNIKPGQWFVPIKGENFDGHRFINDVMEKGAGGFFYAPTSFPYSGAHKSRGVPVRDTLAALQAYARGWRQHTGVRVIGITGSNGKTTTKEMLASVVAAAGESIATIGSLNNEIGVPLTLLRVQPSTQYAVLELAARHVGDIRLLTEIALPDVSVLINVGTAHLGEMGSVENILNTKLEIFRYAPRHTIQVPAHDDPRIIAGAHGTGRPITSFGTHADASVRLLGSSWRDDGGMDIRLTIAGEPVNIHMRHGHQAFPINAAAVCAAAHAAGIPIDAMRRGLANFEPAGGRFKIHRLAELTLIDDAYNANPESMRVGLESVGNMFQARRKVLILGDMLELGSDSPRLHHKIGIAAAAIKPELLVTVGEMARHIAEGATSNGLERSRCRAFDNIEALMGAELDWRAYADVLYVKASHGIKLQQLVTALLKKAERES